MARIKAKVGVMVMGFAFVLAPSRAEAAPVCGTIADFNTYMADNGATSDDVTLTYDVVGVNPADFPESKGSLGQMRNTTCAAGQDVVIKVYGSSNPLNTSHPPGTLKMEYGNQCCTGSGCSTGEKWASPNASDVIFTDGSEQCKVTMWVKPDSIGYKFECGGKTFDGLGDNDEKNVVNHVALLEYYVGSGTTWELPKATASNVQVCYVVSGTPVQSITVPVAEDVTVGPSWPTSMFPDVGDLAVEAADNQAYLKFVVPQIPGKITQARLFMHTRTESSANGAGGEVYPVSSNQWSESSLTWNAKPPASTTSLGRIGPAVADETVSLDLGTATITGPGTYSFAVVSPASDTNGTHFFSKEGSPTDAPYLKLSYETVDSDGDGEPAGPDCNDADPAVHSGVAEQCNGHDDNCDGTTDEGCPGSGTGGSAGTGGGGWGASAGSMGGSSGSGLKPDAGTDEDASSGCACSVRPRGNGWLAAALAMLLFFVRRRR